MLWDLFDDAPDTVGGYYPEVDEVTLAAMITPPGLGDAAGPLGAIAVGLAGNCRPIEGNFRIIERSKQSHLRDSNPRPPLYESGALAS